MRAREADRNGGPIPTPVPARAGHGQAAQPLPPPGGRAGNASLPAGGAAPRTGRARSPRPAGSGEGAGAATHGAAAPGLAAGPAPDPGEKQAVAGDGPGPARLWLGPRPHAGGSWRPLPVARVVAGRRASWEGEVWLHRPTPVEPLPGRPWRAVVDGPGARALGLPAGRFFQVRLAAGTACLGPIVGLYVPGGERPATAVLDLNQGHAVGLDDGLVVCFTPRAVDWERPLWPGTAWVGGRWVEGLFPAPEVVYKRFSITVAHQREWEARWGRRYVFNSNVWLSKWRIHQLLASDPRTAPLLPETRRLAP